MENKLLFSIIIPVYKVERYIRECVLSVLNQDFSDYEIILIDDGSPDSCPQICDELKENDSRIKVIHKDNGGVSAARRDGVSIASGEYIICVDGDDWIREGCLKTLASVIKNTNADIICHGMIYETKNGVVPHELLYRTGLYNKEDIQKEIFPMLIQKSNATYFIPSLCGKAIKKSLLLNNMLVDRMATIGEDGACVISCVFHASSMYIIKECLYFYRYNDTSATKGKKVFNCEWPEIIATHIVSKINISQTDFQEQLYRKIVHDVFSVVVTQFNRKESYKSIIRKIEMIIQRPLYAEAIEKCHFESSMQAKFMHMSLKYRLFFLIYLYAKIKQFGRK